METTLCPLGISGGSFACAWPMLIININNETNNMDQLYDESILKNIQQKHNNSAT